MLSSGSPLSTKQKSKLKNELHSGKVKVMKGKKSAPKKGKKGGAYEKTRKKVFGL